MATDDSLRDLIDEIAPVPEPSPEQRARARADLHASYRREKAKRRRTATHWWRRPGLALAAAAAVAAVFVGVNTWPGGAPSLDANLAEIARAARSLEAEELPEGAYVYSRTDSLTLTSSETRDRRPYWYLLPQTIDVWVQGAFVEERRTTGTPIFRDSEFEAVYYAEGGDAADGVGETRRNVVSTRPSSADVISGLSTDVDELRDQIFEELSADPRWTPDDQARVLEHISQLLEPRVFAPPALRAALLEVLAGLDVATVRADDGYVTVSLAYTEASGGDYVVELEFDDRAFLRLYRRTLRAALPGFEHLEGLAAELVFSRPAIVDGPGVYPGG